MYIRQKRVVLYIYQFTATNPTLEDQELLKSLGLHLRYQNSGKYYYLIDFITNTTAKMISDSCKCIVATSFKKVKMEIPEPTEKELLEMKTQEKESDEDFKRMEDELDFDLKKVLR